MVNEGEQSLKVMTEEGATTDITSGVSLKSNRLHALPVVELQQLMEVDCAGTSSARRRRERRLRSWLRHERMTVAMELAAATHHSSPKGGWPGATHDDLRGQTTASSGGRRPGVLKEPEPPNVVDRVQRHILEQTVSALGLQILDAPVPQTVDQLVTALSHVDSFVPE